MELSLTGLIEDEKNAIQVDFANKFLGGGVLTHGCVQEEIMMLESPEMLTSLLIAEKMDANESITICGCLKISQGEKYSKD